MELEIKKQFKPESIKSVHKLKIHLQTMIEKNFKNGLQNLLAELLSSKLVLALR